MESFLQKKLLVCKKKDDASGTGIAARLQEHNVKILPKPQKNK